MVDLPPCGACPGIDERLSSLIFTLDYTLGGKVCWRRRETPRSPYVHQGINMQTQGVVDAQIRRQSINAEALGSAGVIGRLARHGRLETKRTEHGELQAADGQITDQTCLMHKTPPCHRCYSCNQTTAFATFRARKGRSVEAQRIGLAAGRQRLVTGSIP